MAWEISKDFEFSYGHRVHSQILDPDLSLQGSCKCRHLHGHEGKISIFMGSYELQKTGMVMDFANLRWFDKFLKDYVDHKFIIDEHDPLYELMIMDYKLIEVRVPGTEWVVGKIIDTSDIEADDPEREYFESFFIVDFVPTSEMLAEWAWRVAQCKLIEHDISVFKTVWSETSKSQATYVHEEEPPEAAPADPEAIAAMEAEMEKMRNTWTPPTGGFDLYGANETRGKKK